MTEQAPALAVLPDQLWHVCCGRSLDEALAQPLLPRAHHAGRGWRGDQVVCEQSVYLYSHRGAANAYSGKLKRMHDGPLATPIVAVESAGLDRSRLTIDTEDLAVLMTLWPARRQYVPEPAREPLNQWREQLGLAALASTEMLQAVNQHHGELDRTVHEWLISYALAGVGARQRLMYRGAIDPELLNGAGRYPALGANIW